MCPMCELTVRRFKQGFKNVCGMCVFSAPEQVHCTLMRLTWSLWLSSRAGALHVTGLKKGPRLRAAGILQEAMSRGEYWRLVDSQGRPSGLLGMWPSRAITFIEVRLLPDCRLACHRKRAREKVLETVQKRCARLHLSCTCTAVSGAAILVMLSSDKIRTRLIVHT